MSRVVVDTSLAVKWVIAEIHQVESLVLLAGWQGAGDEVIAPGWFACEVANVLYQRVRKGQIALADARRALREILTRVTLGDPEPVVSDRALELADQFGLTASYDAHYLALAEHLGCDLWTADERFWRAVGPTFPRVKWVGNVTIPAAPPTPPAT